jgi:hypothetical protein
MKLAKLRTLLIVALCAPFLPLAAGAQEARAPARVALMNQLEGHASVQLAGNEAWIDDLVNRPLTSGDRVWVEPGARAELHVGSTALRLGPQSALQLVLVDDNVVRVRLTAGSLSVRLRVLDADDRFIIETPAGELELLTPGGYRVDAEDRVPVARFTVWSGRAMVRAPGLLRDLRSNDSLAVDDDDGGPPRLADAGTPDRLDLWAEQRDQREDEARAARYVPRDMVGYAELDAYGDWSTDPQYGAVWMPRYVDAGWAPFRFGYWSWVGPWGWTWIDDAPWGFAPCHYGNWVRARNGWAWSPGGRREQHPVFAAAVVSWIGVPPGRHDDPRREGPDGRVGWAPRGHARDTGAYTAVTRDTFLAARPIGARRVNLPADVVRRAPEASRPPELAPGFASLGRSVPRDRSDALPARGVFERRIPQPEARGADASRGNDTGRGGDLPRRNDAPRGVDGPRMAEGPRGGDAPRGGRDPRDTLQNGAPAGSGLGSNPPGAGLRQRLPFDDRRGPEQPAQPVAPQRMAPPVQVPPPVQVAPRPAETFVPPPQEQPRLRDPERAYREDRAPRNFEPQRAPEPQRSFEPQRQVEPQRNFEPQRPIEPQRTFEPRPMPQPAYTPPPQQAAPVFRPAPPPPPAPAPQLRVPQATPPPQQAPVQQAPDQGRGRRGGEREQ